MGTNRIEIEVPLDSSNYSAPAMYTAGTYSGGTSGQTYVEGWYFSWETADGGFTNTGWWATDILQGPTVIGGHFTTDAEVTAHIEAGGDLNEAFANWQDYLNTLGAGALAAFNSFTTALANKLEGQGGNCATHMTA